MENINFELYKVFYYVAKNKNLSKAAMDLYISQPAVSQSLKKLEEELETKLFYRTKSGMELTSDGEILYDYLNRPIECLNNSKKYLLSKKENNTMTIRIGGSTTLIKYSLMPVLKFFKAEFPDVKIEIVQGITSELMEMLDNDLLDLVLLSINYKNKNDKRVIVIEEAQDIFCYKSDAFKFDKEFSMSELNDLPLLLQSKVSTSRKFLDSLVSKEHVILKSNYDIGSYSLVLDLVNEGLGVGFVNFNHVKDKIEKNQLKVLRTMFKIPTRKIGICVNKKIVDNTIIKKFIECIKK